MLEIAFPSHVLELGKFNIPHLFFVEWECILHITSEWMYTFLHIIEPRGEENNLPTGALKKSQHCIVYHCNYCCLVDEMYF